MKKTGALFGIALYSTECSCKMIGPPPESGLTEFHKCPLHRAASAMLKVLRVARNRLAELQSSREDMELLVEIKKIIKDAEAK